MTSRSLVQRSPTECGVSERDLATPTLRSRPIRAVETGKIIELFVNNNSF